MSDDVKYKMSISLNVLRHLGLNLYSNTPAVLSEVIANAWDADATEVRINLDIQSKEIVISDNGHGMDLDDINNRYLFVGYERRDHNPKTLGGRVPMGRKGIGKLSLFSIANKIYVYSKKGGSRESFLMDAEKIENAIKGGENNSKQYLPESVVFSGEIIGDSGTTIKITGLKNELTKNSFDGLKRRLARRFGLIEDDDFDIFLNEEKISFLDRDYFHKARFLFQYGEYDYAQHCKKLDDDDLGKNVVIERKSTFDESGKIDDAGEYKIEGWIAIAHHSSDLDEKSGDQDDNLNKITIVVRRKVAQEDILHKYRLGGMITKFIYGEIHADFLDCDTEADIATSGRQGIIEDAPRYIALKNFIEKEIRFIWKKTNTLKENKSLKIAFKFSPAIEEWYERLENSVQRNAKKVFDAIEKTDVDDKHKGDLYANGILAFEKMKMSNALEKMKEIDESNIKVLLKFFAEIDDIEAALYREIAHERLIVIKELRKLTDNNVIERTLQKYIFDHLWLLDPAWERATGIREMEEHINDLVFDASTQKEINCGMRIDIKYRKTLGTHVIIELKRASRVLKKTTIEEQIKKYMKALKKKLYENNDPNNRVEGVCVVGRLPNGWENESTRKEEENSLKALDIRVLTYEELIRNAHSMYKQYVEAHEKAGKLNEFIKRIRDSAAASTPSPSEDSNQGLSK